MADAHLNGAYYGPSVPPPPKTYRAYGRGGGCCGCGCGWCLLKLLAVIIIVLALAGFILWLIIRPQEPKFRVTDATLTRFDHSNSTLRFALALNVTVRNPNKRLGVYYDRIEARAKYEGERFSTIHLTPFYQGHKNTSVVRPVFEGQHLPFFSSGQLEDFNKDRVAGVYNIDVEFRLRIRFKLGSVKSRRIKPDVKCELNVPLAPNNGTRAPTSAVFQPTKCDFDF